MCYLLQRKNGIGAEDGTVIRKLMGDHKTDKISDKEHTKINENDRINIRM